MNVVATDVCKYLAVVDPETGDKFPTITWGDQGSYNGDIRYWVVLQAIQVVHVV